MDLAGAAGFCQRPINGARKCDFGFLQLHPRLSRLNCLTIGKEVHSQGAIALSHGEGLACLRGSRGTSAGRVMLFGRGQWLGRFRPIARPIVGCDGSGTEEPREPVLTNRANGTGVRAQPAGKTRMVAPLSKTRESTGRTPAESIQASFRTQAICKFKPSRRRRIAARRAVVT